MTEYKKTRGMNIIGAIGWALVGVALFFNKIGEQPASVLITIVLMYALLVAVPSMSACALSVESSRRQRTLMIWANWFLIGLWCLSALAALYTHIGLAQALGGILAFVLPETLNSQARRKLNQQASFSGPAQNEPLKAASTGGNP